MLVSLNCLSKLVDISNLSPEEIAQGLTSAGIEVEEIRKMASGTNLVIGEVLECENHPNSDHLHILKVDLGKEFGVEQIVCGAPNARKGLKVIVARVGAKLPEIEIKKGVIRGVESNGMCCSLRELGVEEKYLSEAQVAGIEELPKDAPVGETKVLEYLGLDDVVLNLNVLANRPDLLSLINVAKEVSAIFSRKLSLSTSEERVDFKSKFKVGSATEKCTQFSIKEVKGIVTKPSPKWLANTLNASGIRSINNIVDIGNYVMLMTGQPLHMYDADKLEKQELEARDDYAGEFVALDEKTYEIQKGDIVISSNLKPMCLGGVMGSLSCAVDEKTKNIVIESASFNAATIRRTSNRLGLASESSQRFVKGTNHFQSKEVLNFAAELLFSLADAKECSDIIEYQAEEKKDIVIKTSLSYINNRLGTDFASKEVEDVLSRLSFKIKMNSDGSFEATVPTFRLDVTCDADISEEMVRILGFERVKTTLPCLDLTVGNLTLRQQREKVVREYLLNAGLDECLTYSLVNEKEITALNLLHDEEAYKVLNPLTDDRMYFRTHILLSLLKAAEYNVSHQNKNLALFELASLQSKVSKAEHLSIVLVGKSLEQGLLTSVNYDFFNMKGLLEGIMETLGIETTRYKLERLDTNLDKLHPGKSAKIIFQGQQIGVLGELHPDFKNTFDFGKTPVVVLEMSLESLLESKVSTKKMTSIPRFPSVQRDLSLVVDKAIEVKDLIRTIKMVGKELVSDAKVFDVFEGQAIVSNKKSVTITITFLDEKGTLKEQQVNDVEDKIKFELFKAYKAELRN